MIRKQSDRFSPAIYLDAVIDDSGQLIVAGNSGVIVWNLSTGNHRLLEGPRPKGLSINENGRIRIAIT